MPAAAPAYACWGVLENNTVRGPRAHPFGADQERLGVGLSFRPQLRRQQDTRGRQARSAQPGISEHPWTRGHDRNTRVAAEQCRGARQRDDTGGVFGLMLIEQASLVDAVQMRRELGRRIC